MKKTKEAGIYRKKDGRYRVRATAKDPDGKMAERKKTLAKGATLAEAIEWREILKAKIANNTSDEEVTADTVGSFSVSWIESNGPAWDSVYLANAARTIREHLLPVLGDVTVDALSGHHVRALVAEIDRATKPDGTTYSRVTRQGWYRMCRHLLKDLCAHFGKYDVTNRIKGPRRHGGKPRNKQALTPVQLARVVECSEVDPRHLEILILATTGMRAGELYGLMWDCVDFDADEGQGVLHIRRSASKSRLKPTTKTGFDRSVPMDPRVREKLLELRGDVEHIGLVFPSKNGKPRYASGVRKQLKRISETAGVPFHVTPQTLRRTVNTLVVEKHGEVVARQILGHSAPAMTHHYAATSMATKRAVLNDLAPPGQVAADGGAK